MKYKVWGALLCLCALGLSLAAPLLEAQGASTRYHQHRDAPAKAEETRGSGFATHLPLVELDTGGAEIPGRAVYGEDGRYHLTAEAEASEPIPARMDIVDREGAYNHPGDAPAVSSAITIHVRGNSSRTFDKASYAIRLVAEDGVSNNPQPVMGMDAHHEWALHGPYLDKTLMRNYMWYNIGGEIMDYAPNVRFCELFLNGAYQGVYVMTEKITAGDNGARLPLTVSAKHNTFSGYLLQLNGDRPPSNDQLANQFTHYAKRTPFQLDIVYPGRSNLTPEIQRRITQDFSDFEKALYSYDYDSRRYGYAAMIDTESFVDYFLINELTCNYDAGWLSTYLYKDTSGRFRMCLWDMNSACDNYQESQVNVQGFQMQNCLWYVMLMKDEDFVSAIIRRYWQLRETCFDPDYLLRYIDGTAAYLGEAVDRNFDRWGYTFRPEFDLLQPADRNPRSFAEAVEQMKQFLCRRIQWMDENIDSLRQYSAESRVKKYNENAN